jgi:hypothetical protein
MALILSRGCTTIPTISVQNSFILYNWNSTHEKIILHFPNLPGPSNTTLLSVCIFNSQTSFLLVVYPKELKVGTLTDIFW